MVDLKKALALSKADNCIISRYRVSTENIRWANTSTTTNGQSVDEDIVVISVIGKSVGVASSSLSADTDLEALVRQSEEQARQNPDSEDFYELVQQDTVSVNDTAKLGDSDITVIIDPLQKVFGDARSRGLDVFGYAELKLTHIEIVTSNGVNRRHSQRTGQVELNIKNKGRTVSLWEGQSICRWEDQDIGSMYQTLLTKLEWSQNRVDVDPGKYTVLLEPSAVADLLIYAYWESAARDADEGRTVYSSLRVGEKVLGDGVTIYSDPTEPGYEYADFVATAASSSFESIFDNGAQIGKNYWFKDGTLQSLITPRYYADKTHMSPTYFGENMLWDSDGKGVKELIKDVKDGLLVTCLWYIREVDPKTLLLTGLTRDGIFVIKDGKVIGAANNFRFNMSPIAMLKNIQQTGKSQRTLAREFGDYYTRTRVPPIVVKDFNMSTKSQAL